MRNRGTFFEQPETNKALITAYRKGYEAQKAGMAKTDCPYQDERTPRGGITWSRAFMRSWLDGWEDAQRGLDCRP